MYFQIIPNIAWYTSTSSVLLILLLSFSKCAGGCHAVDVTMEIDKNQSKKINNSIAQCGLRPFRRPERGDSPVEKARSLWDDEEEWDKILGGIYAAYGDIPWQVGVRRGYRINGRVINKHFCGAAIISEFWLISAAHCFYNKKHTSISVIVGDHNLSHNDTEQVFRLSKIIVHEQYRAKEYNYDIAVIMITPTNNGRGIQFNNYVQPICLPDPDDTPTEGDQLLVSGWGLHTINGTEPSETLQQITLPVIGREECKQLLEGNYRDYMICTGFYYGSTDLCRGDSGGPAAFKSGDIYILYGIVSFGTGCSLPNIPAVLTSVPALLSWIKSNINRSSDNESQRTIPSRGTVNN